MPMIPVRLMAAQSWDRLSVERQLDAFLVKAKTEELSQNARSLKREIEKKQAAASA